MRNVTDSSGPAPARTGINVPFSLDAGQIAAISLDLDDTLWPVLPTLIQAEKTLKIWLTEHAPATARRLTPEARAHWRNAVLARHPERAHDMSFIRLHLLRDALSDAGEDPALADEAFEVFLAARQNVSLFDDVKPVLERWQEQYSLIAISNGNADLDRIGLGAWFSVKLSAHEVGMAKPDPRIFALACEKADVQPEQILHIGDNLEVDCLAARSAGFNAAWLRRPELAQNDEIDEQQSEHAFKSLHEIDLALRT